MACERVTLPGGITAIVCGTRKRQRCSGCGRPASLLCDWKVGEGTCDQPICARCTTSPARDKDLCPSHAAAFERWKASKAEQESQRSTER